MVQESLSRRTRRPARRQISGARKAAYYLGLALLVVGFLIFASVIVTLFANFGRFDGIEEKFASFGPRVLLGAGMALVGGLLMSLGRLGAAGSGLILDPERTRDDIEPWARAVGGLVRDAVDEAGIRTERADDEGDSDSGAGAGGAQLPFDERLRRLHKLFEEGILTQEEYEREKREILDEN